jgi:hypothetical protein
MRNEGKCQAITASPYVQPIKTLHFVHVLACRVTVQAFRVRFAPSIEQLCSTAKAVHKIIRASCTCNANSKRMEAHGFSVTTLLFFRDAPHPGGVSSKALCDARDSGHIGKRTATMHFI